MIQALHSLYQQHTDNGGHGIGRCGGKGKHRGQHHNGNNEHCCHGERGHHQERHGECCQQGEQSHEHNGHADHGCCHGENIIAAGEGAKASLSAFDYLIRTTAK